MSYDVAFLVKTIFPFLYKTIYFIRTIYIDSVSRDS